MPRVSHGFLHRHLRGVVMRAPIKITPLALAERFVGQREIAGPKHNPWVSAFSSTIDVSAPADETPWCSTFVNGICWMLGVQRSNSRAARSWLRVGTPVSLDAATPGFVVVVLKRGAGEQPGPEVTNAPGHVGFLYKANAETVWVLGGNQGDAVTIAPFRRERVIGVVEL